MLIEEKKVNGFSVEAILTYGEKIMAAENEKIFIKETQLLNQIFDTVLTNTSKGIIQSDLDSPYFYVELELIKDWKSKFGFSFNIYGGDHFIDNEPHFHFDNKEKGIFCKISFSGEVRESKNNKIIPRKLLKDLSDFIEKQEIRKILKLLWNKKNPELLIK